MLTRNFVTVRTRHDPAALGRVSQELADENINIEAFMVDGDRLSLLTDYPQKAHEVLRTLGIESRIEEVLQFRLPNQRGRLSDITTRLAAAGIPILHGAGFGCGEPHGEIFLRVRDVALAEQALEQIVGGPLQHIER